ncbi:MAG: transporter substrate-binding domain-containing protein [Clostridiales bacterium]|nr:transporter substrate-binding domain-containing protein [Clostridiales bacterium]
MVFIGPSVSHADQTAKKVRVGWYESPFNIIDESGRRSGYAYEYQRKIAAYTGWEYEYVEGTWSDLLEMLIKGEIDLLSDVSYTKERSEKILFSSVPMGQETYFIYKDAKNNDIGADNLSTLNGKRIGVTKNSIQTGIFRQWADQHGITAELVEMDISDNDSILMLLNGELDAFVSLDSYGDVNLLTPVATIGSSEFYFAVSPTRQDLLYELEPALLAIQAEDHYYSEHLYDKYLDRSGAERYLNPAEISWLADHGSIRVGYQDNYLAFCASDPSTGELTGALSNYLNYASKNINNAELVFEPVAYPTADAAMTALKNGEIDCMFPANLTAYDGETMGVVMSQSMMSTEMVAVVRLDDQHSFFEKDKITVAVNAGNPNYDLFLKENFPDWNSVHYVDTPTCLKAVSEGNADCVIVSNYRYNNIADICEELKLGTVSTGVVMDYSFAIKDGNTTLYSIMAKVTGVVPESITHSALNYFATEDTKVTFGEFVRDNLGIIMSIVSAVLLLFLILSIRNVRLVRKTLKGKEKIKALDHRANYDALTSVRNKGAFTEYIDNVQTRINNGETESVAVCIFDCNDLKKINDVYGHDKGDEYIKNACHFICTTFRRSAVFRIGGDEFAAVLMNEDFLNRDNLTDTFSNEQIAISEAAVDPWNKLHIAMGMAIYTPGQDSSLNDTISRADDLMYENKKFLKEAAKANQ